MKKTKLILPFILSTFFISSVQAYNLDTSLFNIKTVEKNKIEKTVPYKIIDINTEIAQLLQIIITKSNGFISGENFKISDIPILVFFDPQCDVCKAIWKNANSENNKNVYGFWIPIGFLNDNSEKQANTIISSKDPKTAMNELINGVLKLEETEQGKEKIDTNNYILGKMEFDSVPLILKITKDNKLVVANNYLSEADLRIINNL